MSSLSATQQLLDQWKGEVVPRSFNGGLVTVSYIVSVIGAASTLELINRRTSPKGSFNILLLVGSAILMGGISIWGMHYVGNRAINLLNGEPELHVVYSPGFTALSFFVPIVVLLGAFMAIGTRNPVPYWRVAAGGLISGAAICGMHYLGNASIQNYICVYNVANVIGAAVIAVAASCIALLIFFVFRASWTNSWWRRALTALLLACATSGMHWCAATGTQYILVSLNTAEGDYSEDSTVVVVICLTVGACIILAACCVYTARKLNRYAHKAQHVSLAAVVFDKHGRVLVSREGLLPSEIITESFVEKNSEDSFTVAHPLFHWMFQASRSWDSVNRLVTDMRRHLALLPRTKPNTKRDAPRGGVKLTDDNGELVPNYELILRELFCSAAQTLAEKLKTSLLQVGILWDEVVPTGGLRGTRGTSRQPRREARHHGIHVPRSRRGILLLSDNQDRAEKGIFGAGGSLDVGRGSVMFLVRHATSAHEVARLEAAGFCFAELDQVSGIIGPSLQVDAARIREKLQKMSAYADEDSMLAPGVHLGFFGMRARVKSNFGFDVLARKEARNLLPSVPMLLHTLDASQLGFLSRLNRLTADEIIRSFANTNQLSPPQALFASRLLDCLRLLRTSIDHTMFDDATLAAKVVEVPCRPETGGPTPNKAVMIVLRRLIPIHLNVDDDTSCEFVPLNFFKVRQLVYKDSPHRLSFSRSVHLEMLPLLGTLPVQAPKATAKPASSSRRLASVADISDTVSSRRLRQHPSRPSTATRYGSSDAEETPVTDIFTRRSNASASTPDSRHSSFTIDWKDDKDGQAGSGGDNIDGGGGGGGGSGNGSDNGGNDGDAIALDTLVPYSKLTSGILVSQEITVDVQEVSESTTPYSIDASGGHFPPPKQALLRSGHELYDDGRHRIDAAPRIEDVNSQRMVDFRAFQSKVTAKWAADDATPTFVDELFTLCTEGR